VLKNILFVIDYKVLAIKNAPQSAERQLNESEKLKIGNENIGRSQNTQVLVNALA